MKNRTSSEQELDRRLCLAAHAGRLRECRDLISWGADVNAVDSASLSFALGNAAAAGHEAIVELLLASGAAVDDRIDAPSTPLHHAARGGHLGVVRLLIGAGADLHREALREPATATSSAEMAAFIGFGQDAVAAYLRSIGGTNPYDEPNRPDDFWDGVEGQVTIMTVEGALRYRVSPIPFVRPLANGRERKLYSCRYAPTRWLVRLLFTVDVARSSGHELGIVLPHSWPTHKAALALERFAWPLDFVARVSAAAEAGQTLEHGDLLERGHPALAGAPFPDSIPRWLVLRHASLEKVRLEVAKGVPPPIHLLVPLFGKKKLAAGPEARAMADAKAKVAWDRPALGTARNGLVVPMEAAVDPRP